MFDPQIEGALNQTVLTENVTLAAKQTAKDTLDLGLVGDNAAAGAAQAAIDKATSDLAAATTSINTTTGMLAQAQVDLDAQKVVVKAAEDAVEAYFVANQG